MPATYLEAAFRDQVSKGRLALVPFLTAGHPDPASTVEIAVALAGAGATALELGIPFSDPIADGPVIQKSSQVALSHGAHVGSALEMARAIRARVDLPIVAMTYANPILRFGAERFASEAAASGVDGVIITDTPPEELPGMWAPLRAAGLATILLVTPLTRADRFERILRDASGYVYVVSRTGVTGAGEAARGLDELLLDLKTRTRLPVAVGFGIETPKHVRAYRGKADGVVVGSALVRRVDEAGPASAPAVAAAFLKSLSEAC